MLLHLSNSHDMVSLFTNICIQIVTELIRDTLVKEKALSKYTDVSTDNIMSLLKFIISMTYFQFTGVLYQQAHGASIRSLVSVVVAAIFMEDLVQSTTSSAPPPPPPRHEKPKVLEKKHRSFILGGEKGT